MQDGLKTENFLGGSFIGDTISGVQFAVGPGEIGYAEMASNAISGAVVAAGGVGTIGKIFAGALDADTNTLSSGSRWVTFRSAFAATPFVMAGLTHNAAVANTGIETNFVRAGSVAAGSFLAIGSPATYTFNWIAIGSR